MSARDADEIRADLATAEGRGSATRQSPTGRLVADVEPLLNEVERMADTLSDIFCEITGGRLSYPTYDARTIITQITDTLDAEIATAVAEVEAERGRLRGVVQAVETLHRLNEGGSEDHGWCRECGHGYPCPTVLAASLPVPTVPNAKVTPCTPNLGPFPVPTEPTPGHVRPTPQADRRLAELQRLGVLHPDKDDQPDPGPVPTEDVNP